MESARGVIPLHDAAQKDRPDEVRALLAARADVDVKEKANGWSALHVAAGSGASLAVEALLECSASVESTDNDGETPLHLAAGEGQTRVIHQLVKAGAAVNGANNDGETPLHVAVQQANDKPGLAHIRALVELRADPSVKDRGHNVFEAAGLHSKNLDRAEEVRAALRGAPAPAADPDDPWPDVPGDLEPGVEPITVAESLRQVGNARFKEQRFEDAVKCYFKAKRFLPTGPAQFESIADGDVAGARARACAVAVSSNAAFCKLKLCDYEACVNMCDGVLTVDPGNVKAHFRKALALRAQGSDDDAERALQQAAELDPKDAAVRKELSDIARLRKEDKEKAKRVAQKMFG